jgi:hypothetical protein
MTDSRLTRAHVEALVLPTPARNLTRAHVEVLLDVVQYAQMAAVVQPLTADVTLLREVDTSLTATVQRPTGAFVITTPETEASLTATVPRPVADLTVVTGDLAMTAVVPAPYTGPILLTGFSRKQAVLAAGPSIFYDFEEASGATVHDTSGNGNDGTATYPTWGQASLVATDPLGHSLSFYDAAHQTPTDPPRVSIPMSGTDDDLTVEFLMTYGASQGPVVWRSGHWFIETGQSGNSNFLRIVAGWGGLGSLAADTFCDMVIDPQNANSVLAITVRFTPTSVTIGAGPLACETTFAQSVRDAAIAGASSTAPISLGGTQTIAGSHYAWRGKMDQFAYYDRLLTDDEINSHGRLLVSLVESLSMPAVLFDTNAPVHAGETPLIYTANVPRPVAAITLVPEDLGSLTAVVRRPTAAFTLTPINSLNVTAAVPRPTASLALDLGPGVTLAAVVARPVADVQVYVPPQVTVTAVVPAPTADVEVVINPEVSLTATVPRPTTAANITLVRDMTLAAVVRPPVAAVTLSLARSLALTAVVDAPDVSFTLAAEADVSLAAVVDRPTLAVTLGFPPQTDRTNRVGGRTRSGIGVAEWDPPVASPPPTLAAPRAWVYAQAFDTPVLGGLMPRYGVWMQRAQRLEDRIIIGNTDVTYLRGVPTPFPGYGLVEPLMYGPTTITLPQIAAAFEVPGEGALSWLAPGKQVLIQRVDPTTRAVVAEDYVGVVIGFDHSGPTLTVQVGGEAQGRAALVNRQVPIWTSVQDIGRYAYSAFKDLGLRLTPYLGPTTGVRLERFGGQSVLDYISELVSRSWNREGNRWTIMPDRDAGTRGVYKMKRKDTTTIRATAYLDDTRVVGALHRDLAEEPNRIFGTGVTPAGERIRNGVYPGLRQTAPAPYPFHDGRDFGPGTTDADTDTGDGITVMIQRLIITKYLDQNQTPGGYDNDVTRAVERLQDDASDGPSFITGTMDTDTWDALYDLNVTGYSLRWSHIEPMAQRPYVRKWRRSGTGAVMGRNPRYRPAALVVDRNIDFGSGFTADAMGEWATAELGDDTPNYTGSISINLGALVRGRHDPGDDLEPADVFNARDLRPGDNLWLPLFAGGIVVHIAAVNVGPDGTTSVDVDTRARDAMEVWEVIDRNRQSRNSPARAWMADHRSSTMTKDSMGIWDEVGGLLGDPVPVPANQWTVFPVVAGQEGTVRSLRLRTDDPAEFVVAIFGDTIYASRLARLIGNPFTHEGKAKWSDQSVRDDLDKTNILLYVAGDKQDPCGYYPATKHVEDDPDTTAVETGTNPLTGRWEDDAGFSYHTGRDPVLYVAVFADRATTIPRGRLMWNQLEAGV